MIELCASLLAANHAYIARDMLEAERCGIKTFHFDVSDGHFAKYLLFGSQLVSDVRPLSSAYFDVHLAVYHMESILETFLPTGANCINLQYEAAGEALPRMIDSIHRAELDVCLTFIPDTPYEVIQPYIDQVEAINILAVNPGIGGQQFNDRVLSKVERCASYMNTYNRPIRLSVDGGVNRETLRSVQSSGANMAIIGSAIFCGPIEENIEQLRAIIA